jgi:hypothetical protein
VPICASIGPPALLRERYSAGFLYGNNSVHQNIEFAVPTLAIGSEARPGVPASLMATSLARNSTLQVPTPRDGVVRYNVPAALSGKAGEIGLISVNGAGWPSSKRYVSCAAEVYAPTQRLENSPFDRRNRTSLANW